MNRSNNILSLVKNILLTESRHLLRTAILPAVLCILLVSAAIALLYGRNISVTQKAATDSLRHDYRQQYEKLYAQLQADTSTPQGKTDFISATHPAVVDHRIHRSVYHMPAAFSLMAVGMSDIAKHAYPITVKGGYEPAEEKVINPERLLSGNFDVAFLFIYLLPLIAICLSYNLLAQEKEQGTLALLVIQRGSITGTLLIRLLLRYLILLAVILLISAGGLLLAPADSHPWRELPAWLGVSGAYIAFWMALIWFILSWNASAPINLMAMLGAWLLLLVVVPASSRFVMQQSFTDDIADNASRQRAISWETWELPQKQLLDSFYATYPQYRNQHAYDTGVTSSRRAMAYYELADRRMQRIINSQQPAHQRSQQAVTASYRYNPAVYTQSLLNSIARTDVTDYAQFRDEADRFRDRWKHFFYRLHFNDLSFTAADYQALPVYEPAYDASAPARWQQGIWYLLLLTAIWLLAGIFVLWKRHVQYDH